MSRERLIGSYLIRFTEHDERASTQLRDLRTGTTLEFETWVAAWEYLDTFLRTASPRGVTGDASGRGRHEERP